MAVDSHGRWASSRARELRGKGFSWSQIVDVLALDHAASPLRLARLARDRSASDVVDEFNQMDPARTATLRVQRLYDYEMWPESGRRPAVRVLVALARIYQTTARRLVTDSTYASYSADDQAEIDSADCSYLDPNHPRRATMQAQADEQGGLILASTDSPDDGGGSAGHDIVDELVDSTHGESVELFRAVTRMESDPPRQETLFQLALVLGGVSGLPLVHKLNPDERERLAQVTLSPQRVDAKVVTTFANVTKLCRQLYDSRGPESVLKAVLRIRAVVADIIGDAERRALRDRLLCVHAELSQLAGWLLYDLASFTAADRCFKEGLAAAQEIRDAKMIAFIHLCLGQMGCFRHQIPTAIDHAFAARGWAGRSGNARLASYAETTAAWGFSIDKNKVPTNRALNRAEELLPDQFCGDDPDFTRFLDRGFAVSVRAGCWLRLGQLKPALQAAEDSMALTDPAFPRNRGFRLWVRARTLVLQKEIEEGARLTEQVADIAASQNSMRLTESVEDVRRLMQPWAHIPAVRRLDEQLVTLGLVSRTG